MYFKDLKKSSTEFKSIIYKSFLMDDQYFFLSTFLNKKKFNATKINVRKKCLLTERGRGNYNSFSLSRAQIRLLANIGLLPGLKKSS